MLIPDEWEETIDIVMYGFLLLGAVGTMYLAVRRFEKEAFGG